MGSCETGLCGASIRVVRPTPNQGIAFLHSLVVEVQIEGFRVPEDGQMCLQLDGGASAQACLSTQERFTRLDGVPVGEHSVLAQLKSTTGDIVAVSGAPNLFTIMPCSAGDLCAASVEIMAPTAGQVIPQITGLELQVQILNFRVPEDGELCIEVDEGNAFSHCSHSVLELHLNGIKLGAHTVRTLLRTRTNVTVARSATIPFSITSAGTWHDKYWGIVQENKLMERQIEHYRTSLLQLLQLQHATAPPLTPQQQQPQMSSQPSTGAAASTAGEVGAAAVSAHVVDVKTEAAAASAHVVDVKTEAAAAPSPHIAAQPMLSVAQAAQRSAHALCRQSDDGVVHRRHNLRFREFMEQYAMRGRAVIITDYLSPPASSGTAAATHVRQGAERARYSRITPEKWTMELLQERCGARYAQVMQRKMGASVWGGVVDSGDMRFGEYLEQANSENGTKGLYVFDVPLLRMCPQLLRGFRMPKYFVQDYLQRVPHSRNMHYRDSWPSIFVAPKGLDSSLHVDTFGSAFWMGQLQGRKHWRFFESAHKSLLYEEPITKTFAVDAFQPNFTAHPLLRFAPCHDVVLQPGELMFVPANSPHQVRNLDNTIAIAGNYIDSANLEISKYVTRPTMHNGQVLEVAWYKEVYDEISRKEFPVEMDLDAEEDLEFFTQFKQPSSKYFPPLGQEKKAATET